MGVRGWTRSKAAPKGPPRLNQEGRRNCTSGLAPHRDPVPAGAFNVCIRCRGSHRPITHRGRLSIGNTASHLTPFAVEERWPRYH